MVDHCQCNCDRLLELSWIDCTEGGGGVRGFVQYEGFGSIMTRQALSPFEKGRVDSCGFIIATLLGVVGKVAFSGC